MPQQPTWQSIASRKQAERESRIPSEWRLKTIPSSQSVLTVPRTSGILTQAELSITETKDATALLSAIHSRRLSSTEVVTAFCKRAAIAQQVTNCLTEILFTEAIAQAKELDTYMARTGKPRGPLHGLPMSVKDTFKIRGHDASVGIAALCFKPAETNSTLVDILLDAGAVIIAKTNIPQTMMALDSHNNIFGRTMNPANRLLTAGGSSGGEGALIAMRGSMLGIGTDNGGSVRIPAMCHGLVGVKPSHGRLSYAYQEGGSKEGSDAVTLRASAGPIALSVRDAELVFKVASELRSWERDPEVVPQSWEAQLKLEATMHGMRGARPLRIGVVRTDGVTRPLPPITRFMDEIANTLKKTQPRNGVPAIEVVDMNITTLLKQCQTVVNKAFSIDGANNWFDLLEATGEPLSPWMASRLTRRPQYSLDRVKEVHGKRSTMQTEFLRIWNEAGGHWTSSSGTGDATLDAIICPVAPHPVPEIDRWNTASYTSAWVLLDYPSACLPVRKVQTADLDGELSGEALSSWDKANMKLWNDVNRNVYLDSPLCIQVVTQKLQERKLLDVMQVLENVLQQSSGERPRL